MKKTLTVNLGGTVFNIDDDAYIGHRTKRFFQWSGKMGERL